MYNWRLDKLHSTHLNRADGWLYLYYPYTYAAYVIT